MRKIKGVFSLVCAVKAGFGKKALTLANMRQICYYNYVNFIYRRNYDDKKLTDGNPFFSHGAFTFFG